MDTEKEQVFIDFRHSITEDGDESIEKITCIRSKLITEGLIKDVGLKNFSVLMAIISYTNEKGISYVSLRTLSDVTGVTVKTLNKYVHELLKVEIDGKPILERKLVGTDTYAKSMYTVGNFSVTNSDVEQELDAHTITTEDGKKVPAPESARDFVVYFMHKYEEHYGKGYVPNWGRETTMIKNKLLNAYDAETLRKVIDVVVEEYPERWANANYPLPTIGMLSTWLGNKAYAVVQENEKQEQAAALRRERAEQDANDPRLQAFLGGEL